MRKCGFLFLLWAVFVPALGIAQDPEVEPAEKSKATAVYGVTVEDYLPAPSAQSSQQHVRPRVKRSHSFSGFNLPDGVLVGGGILVLVIFIWLLTTFIQEFEEKREEERRRGSHEEINTD